MIFLRLVVESFLFAGRSLQENSLRTILSLLGVTVGIFAIISVFTIVDSLERSIKDSMSFLGDKVIRIEKWPWLFEDNYPWWKYFKRPNVTISEYEYLSGNVKFASGICIFAEKSNSLVQYRNNTKSEVNLTGISLPYNKVFDVPVQVGRYFSVQEVERASNVAIIGTNIAQSLFLNGEPMGKELKINGLKFRVIGILEQQGENFIDAPSIDDNCFIPYGSFLKLYEANNAQGGLGSAIALKAFQEDKGGRQLEYELEGLMRKKRALRPMEENNFAINRTEAFEKVLDNIFGIIGIAGGVIGSFSILVGGFGIANIMFVSVKERTSIIGIQKSLGAKSYFILFQFLFESVFLSLLGGVFGLFMVYIITFIHLGSLELELTLKNVILGLSISSVIGIVSGILPALMASRLDPVEAIRS